MGNLLGGVSFREPTTVEDCDSTWQTDSEPEPEQPGPAGGGEGQEQDEREQPEQPPERAGGRPRASPVPEDHAEAAGAEQVRGPRTHGGPGGAVRPVRGRGLCAAPRGVQGGMLGVGGAGTWGSLRCSGSPGGSLLARGPCCEHRREVPQGKPRLHSVFSLPLQRSWVMRRWGGRN